MKKRLAASPYLIWILLFTIIPLILVFYYSFTTNVDGNTVFTLDNYKRFADPLYLDVLWRSIVIAFMSTVICLALGFPMAMILSKMPMSSRSTILLLFVIPMWMNFLLRTYSWLTLLEKNGLINKLLEFLHLPTLNIIYTDQAVMLGMVYNFLPFMILPIYSVLIKIDHTLVEAAEDLGADKLTVFKKVILPLSLPGVISGIIMVFMPAVTTFVISNLLGGGQYTLIGNLIEQQFIAVGDWGFGSAISIVMMLVILISMGILSRYERGEGKTSLW